MLASYNFTGAVREALAYGRGEALRLGHESLGTEHLFLGVLATANGCTATLLDPLDISRMRAETERRAGPRRVEPRSSGDLPYTSPAKRVLELAMREARELGHDAVGTEHLLLGLLQEEQGIAANVLSAAGLRIDAARNIVTRRVAGAGKQSHVSLRRFLRWIVNQLGMLSRG
jgi:ATP-dependent Clp protease ATP-binding subunit ClpC